MKTRMLMDWRSGLRLAICVCLLDSCSLMPQSRINRCAAGASLTNPEVATGIGGTGQVAVVPGIGGTGQLARAPGIGGTGQVAQRPGIGKAGGPQALAEVGVGGTGIVGVVTGFASICVNGEEVHYSPSTPVLRDGERSSTSELLVGHVVAIRAAGTLSESGVPLEAQQIAVLSAAVGPLTSVDAASGQFAVMGQKAQALAREDLVNLRVGDWVRVSGHRLADGDVRAGRVERLAAPLPLAQVLGPVLNIDGKTLVIGTTPVQLKSLPVRLTLGSEMLVRGAWNGNYLEATSNTLEPLPAELGAVKELLLQGYVHARRGNELILGYGTVQLSDTTRVSGGRIETLQIDQQVLLRGRVDASQHIVAEQLTIGSDSGAGGSRGGVGSLGHGSGLSGGGLGNGRSASGGGGRSGGAR